MTQTRIDCMRFWLSRHPQPATRLIILKNNCSETCQRVKAIKLTWPSESPWLLNIGRRWMEQLPPIWYYVCDNRCDFELIFPSFVARLAAPFNQSPLQVRGKNSLAVAGGDGILIASLHRSSKSSQHVTSRKQNNKQAPTTVPTSRRRQESYIHVLFTS